MKVALDAMSGDYGPSIAVEGAVNAVKNLGIKVILVGKEDILKRELDKLGYFNNIEIYNASEIITMHDKPALAVRRKKDSSVVVAAKLVKEGHAAGFFSPGNTGATLTASLFHLGLLKGIKRPALASPIPTLQERPAIITDAGANVDCKPSFLVQFAILGEIYYRNVFNIDRPRVGLLSIGEEPSKGNELIREAYDKMRSIPFNFVGNVESKEVFQGKVDIAICDGFVGNIFLKTTEGSAEAISIVLKNSIKQSKVSMFGAAFMTKAFKVFKSKFDYAEYGGAPFLGVNGVCVVGHGRSNAKAYFFGLKTVKKSVEKNINQIILDNIKDY